jgi:nucleosome binding factor SPN SPT16 subunit
MKESAIEGKKLKVGILQKDKNEGPMIQEWSSFFSSNSDGYEVVDVAPMISSLLASKDAQELVIDAN